MVTAKAVKMMTIEMLQAQQGQAHQVETVQE